MLLARAYLRTLLFSGCNKLNGTTLRDALPEGVLHSLWYRLAFNGARNMWNCFPGTVALRFSHGNTFTDLTHPESWYPEARRMRRKIIAHLGPTNSGCSMDAMLKFMEKFIE
jgi:hypothetical protein